MKTVVLAGGSGTRLFPLSRKKYPKQFLKIKDKTLFQDTVERNLLNVDKEDIIIITNNDYQFLVKNQLKDIDAEDIKHIILEPVGRNTAPAITLAVKYVQDKIDSDEDEIIFVTPSDHIIHPAEKFSDYVEKAKEIAKKGFIVTFGIRPNKPETGYGYIESGEKIEDKVYSVKKFHEKPDLEKAKEYLFQGNFFWNSGMFMFSIKTILEELRKYSPYIYEQFEKLTYEELVMNFSELPDISIDYAVMEKTDKATVIPVDITWSDVGSWDSVYDIMEKDKNRNVKVGDIFDIDTKESLIFGEKRVVSTIGVENLIIVDTDDVLLIAKRGEGQKVRKIVERLKENPRFEEKTEFHTTVYRPWGSYTELETGERYKIKKIRVEPGESLSLQMHYHRSEHWVVIKGTAKVILEKDGKEKAYFLHENESIYVPKTTKHRLMNPGKVPLEIIEVQVGEYVGEDDIVRFDDKYNRV